MKLVSPPAIPKELRIDERRNAYNEQIISHVADVGVNYLSL